MNESFEAYSTLPEIPSHSELKLLRDDLSEFQLLLTAPNELTYKISFPNVLAYQLTDEGDRLRSMDYLNGKAETPIGRINNSTWLQWFVEETLHIRDSDTLVHWCIVTPNSIIDVISEKEPITELLDTEK